MFIIYHNPRCSKSRAALNLLQQAGADIRIVSYLQQPPNVEQLHQLLQKLDCPVREMLRASEAIHAELQLDREDIDDTQLLQALAQHPQLLQRPIVVRGQRAIIARPPQRVHELLT